MFDVGSAAERVVFVVVLADEAIASAIGDFVDEISVGVVVVSRSCCGPGDGAEEGGVGFVVFIGKSASTAFYCC